jgi:hypothetical protein
MFCVKDDKIDQSNINMLHRNCKGELDSPTPAEAPTIPETLDLGEAAAAAVPPVLTPWPTSLPEQVTAIAKILTAAARPLSSRDVARVFDGKRASTVEPVLNASRTLLIARAPHHSERCGICLRPRTARPRAAGLARSRRATYSATSRVTPNGLSALPRLRRRQNLRGTPCRISWTR